MNFIRRLVSLAAASLITWTLWVALFVYTQPMVAFAT